MIGQDTPRLFLTTGILLARMDNTSKYSSGNILPALNQIQRQIRSALSTISWTFFDCLSTANRYKQRVLSFIFSHVVAIGLASAKCTLLRSTENISDQVKVQALFPCLQELVQSPILGGRLGPHLEEYTALLLSSFDISSSNELNDPESSFRSVFISSLRQFFQPG